MTTPTTGTATSAAARYALPSMGGTVWLGLTLTAVVGLAVTLLACVTLLLAATPLPVVLTVAALGAAGSAWPVAGRTPATWLPLLAGAARRALVGSSRWYLPLPDALDLQTRPDPNDAYLGADPEHDVVQDRAADGRHRPRRRDVRPLLGSPTARHLRLEAIPEDPADAIGDPVAVLRDRATGSVSVVLAVSPAGRFGLLDPRAQDSELHRFGTALAGLLALPGLLRVTWLVHTRPDTTPTAELAGTDGLAQDQMVLLRHAREQAVQHRYLLVLTLSGDRDHTGMPATARRRSSSRRTDLTTQRAAQVARDAASVLLGADLLSYPLTAHELPRVLRELTDPRAATPALDDTSAPAGPVVLSGRSGWTSCRTDDTDHRAFAVTGWPRTLLGADWLAPLLHHPPAAGTARTLTVQCRPVPAAAATRRARAATAKAQLDATDRQRLGFTPAASSALDETDAAQTEAELVAGYPMADITALLLVHAPTTATCSATDRTPLSATADTGLLETASTQLATTAVTQRLVLRPLHGQHDQALAAALPLGLSFGGSR